MISAYAIGSKVYVLSTAKAADPEMPRTLPIGSPALTAREALACAAQMKDAAEQALRMESKPLPKVRA